jgi:hypothetical protein
MWAAGIQVYRPEEQTGEVTLGRMEIERAWGEKCGYKHSHRIGAFTAAM